MKGSNTIPGFCPSENSVPVFSRPQSLEKSREFFGLRVLYKFTQKILLVSAYFIGYVLCGLKVKGRENISKNYKGPLLVVANHKGFLDPILVGLCFPFFSRIYPLRFMAKDDFFKNFFSRILFKSLGTCQSFYGQGLEKSLETPLKWLNNGATVVFFPEGKCFLEKGIAPFKPGIGILAASFPDIPILPISIYGGYNISKRLMRLQRPKLLLNIGHPFTLSEKIAANPSVDPISFIRAEIEKLYSETF